MRKEKHFFNVLPRAMSKKYTFYIDINVMLLPIPRLVLAFLVRIWHKDHFHMVIITCISKLLGVCPVPILNDITKTCLYNFDPLKPHFYIVNWGLQG